MPTLFEKIQGLFGYQAPELKEPVKVDSFIQKQNRDGAIEVDADVTGGAHSHLLNLDVNVKNEIDLINKYRDMQLHAEVDSAIDDIVNEAIVSENNVDPVKINLQGIENLSESINKKIADAFIKILRLMHFSANGHDIFREWYVDGRLYYHMELGKNSDIKKGIQNLIRVDSTQITKLREIQKKADVRGVEKIEHEEDFYVYTPLGMTGQSLKVSDDSIVFINSGLIKKTNNKNIIIGFLHKAIKPLNQLRMVEDGSVIYRLARAPERRVFYIDVGNLPKVKAEAYLQGIMTKYKNKIIYDASTGDVKDQKHHLAITEDYYLPRREGGRGTEISTLPGGENLGVVDDIEYFKKKLHKALNIPSSRLESDSTFNLGRSSEITRDELKFAKYVGRLRKKFSQLFSQLLRVELTTTKVLTAEEWEEWKDLIKYDFVSDSYFAELKNAEVMKERLDLLTTMDEFTGKYFSKEYVQKNILRQTPQEIKDIKKQIEAEDKAGEINEFDPDLEDQMAIGLPPKDGGPLGVEQPEPVEPVAPAPPGGVPQEKEPKDDEEEN